MRKRPGNARAGSLEARRHRDQLAPVCARRTYQLARRASLGETRIPLSPRSEKCPDLLRHFVFITGTSEHADYHGFIDDVKVPVLTKPFDVADLQRIAWEILAVLCLARPAPDI
jgi:hypothetical protein